MGSGNLKGVPKDSKEKKLWHVWFLRSIAILAPILALILAHISRARQGSDLDILQFISAVIILLWVALIYDVLFLKFDYTALGRLKRTLPVRGRTILAQSSRAPLWYRVSIGKAWFPSSSPFRIVLYPSGLEIRLIGKETFIPVHLFVEIKIVSRVPAWFELYHTSPEIKSPIGFGDKSIFNACEILMHKYANTQGVKP